MMYFGLRVVELIAIKSSSKAKSYIVVWSMNVDYGSDAAAAAVDDDDKNWYSAGGGGQGAVNSSGSNTNDGLLGHYFHFFVLVFL